jgi:4-hydroxy-tetrahydrodipicolinate synthase
MFTGCGTALVTPFRSDLSLDEDALRRLVQWQVQSGIHFLVPCGTTGESPTLTKKEHLRVVEITLEEAKGKIPILAGAGGYNTTEVAALAAELEAMEVDGLLSVTPYYNRPTPQGLYEHYKVIAAATRLPIVVYNVPSRTGTNILPATLAQLASIDNIVGVKEASGNIGQMAAIFQVVPKTFAVLSGDDAVTLSLMALGGVGLISVASNQIPAEMSALCSACLKGDFNSARVIHRRYHELMETNFIETSPGPVKAALAMMGRIEPYYRLPMVAPRPENRAKIEKVLSALGLVAPVGAAAN